MQLHYCPALLMWYLFANLTTTKSKCSWIVVIHQCTKNLLFDSSPTNLSWKSKNTLFLLL